jgi:hypothetical protein
LTGDEKKIPPALEKIMRRCLEKRRSERFQSTHDLGFALEALSTSSQFIGQQSDERGQCRSLRKRKDRRGACVCPGS